MRNLVLVGTTALTACLSIYGCNPTDDAPGGEAGAPSGGKGGSGGSAASGGSSGKATGGSSGSQGESGSAGESSEAGAPGSGGSGATSGSSGKGGKGGSSGKAGGTARGGSSTGGDSGEPGGGAGVPSEGGTGGGVVPVVCVPGTTPGTATWSDGFESGGLDWDITGGVWAIGEPTATDGPQPFAGANVAGTVLGGDYGPSVDAWLVSPALDVPAAKKHPRFSFRYWYELAAGDAAYFYLRADGGSWTEITRLSASGDGDWRQIVVPLEGYADRQVEFGYRLITNSSANAAGVYIDDVRFSEGEIGMGNCETFEDGWGNWTAYNGVWDIGKPTADDGPTAFEGEMLAGTILSGDYGDSNDAWLVSPLVEVPDADEEPRISFKYWYELASGDAGYIYLRTNGGSWTELTRLAESGDGSWRNLTYPLNAAADNYVELAFRLITNTSAYAPGFYVDDVHFETGPVAITKKQGFENGYDGWSVYNGVWAVGKPTADDGPDAHGGANVAGTILSGDYGNSNDAWLVSPRVFIPQAATSAKVAYWYWYSLAAGDAAYVYVRSDGGSWTELDRLSAAADDTWRQKQVDLSAYADHTIELGYRLITNTSAYAPGFYIDDVTFTLE